MTYRYTRCVLAVLLTALTMLPFTTVRAQNQDNSRVGQDAFPYPQMPETLRTVEERAHYLMLHYWDGIDFRDTTLIHRQDITEIGFVNFIDLLPRVDSVSAAEGAAALGRRVFADDVPHAVKLYYAELAERYLDSQDSPLCNSRSYVTLLEGFTASPGIDEATAGGFRYLIANLRKNRQGCPAADFTYADRSGKLHQMYDTDAEYTVLFFYNPDCDICHHTASQLSTEPLLVSDSRVKVLAVYADADEDAWKAQRQSFPSSWTDGHSPEGDIVARQTYFIRSTPSIYLLDRQKTVLLQDCTATEFVEKLASLLR